MSDRHGDWVVKRTGVAHSGGAAVAAWLRGLRLKGVAVVTPVERFAPNPRRLDDGNDWVVYPFVSGAAYDGATQQIEAAGELLGAMHAACVPEESELKRYDLPIVRSAAWIERQAAQARAAMRPEAAVRFSALLEDRRMATRPRIPALPLAGGSFDFKASNLVFVPSAVLVDPDHAALLPRVYDLAIAALLFHNDAPLAPARLWNAVEWRCFLTGYQRKVELTPAERKHWPQALNLAWLDQAVWLLGNFPEGWSEAPEASYFSDLANCDLDRFGMP